MTLFSCLLIRKILSPKAIQDEAIKYKANIDMLMGMGKVIITITAKPGEELMKQPDLPITRDLQTINGRYDDIWRDIERRGVDLETTLNDADKYFSTLNEATAFLDDCEKTLANQPAIANDLPSIQKQLVAAEVSVHVGVCVLRFHLGQQVIAKFDFNFLQHFLELTTWCHTVLSVRKTSRMFRVYFT